MIEEISETDKIIYEKIRKIKNEKSKRNLLKSFGGTIASFYVFFSSIILGNLCSILYIYLNTDTVLKDFVLNKFGIYSLMIANGILSTTFSLGFLMLALIGLVLYHKSAQITEEDKHGKI